MGKHFHSLVKMFPENRFADEDIQKVRGQSLNSEKQFIIQALILIIFALKKQLFRAPSKFGASYGVQVSIG
jgi:hypothetical protein